MSEDRQNLTSPLSSRSLDEPAEDRLAPDDPFRSTILEAHRVALAHDEDGYLDPKTGAFVFTAAFLASQHRCCGNGCRHCPYC